MLRTKTTMNSRIGIEMRQPIYKYDSEVNKPEARLRMK